MSIMVLSDNSEYSIGSESKNS